MKDSDETTKQKPRSRERRIRENVGREVTDVTFAALIAKKWSYKTQAGTVRSGPNKKDHGLLMLLDNKSTPPVHRLFCNICSAPVSEKVGQHIGGHRHHNLHIAALSKKVIATSVENESVTSAYKRSVNESVMELEGQLVRDKLVGTSLATEKTRYRDDVLQRACRANMSMGQLDNFKGTLYLKG